jgi:hypothetical protein
MTTPAKKEKTAEGAEPEVKTDSAVAEGNEQNAANVIAAIAESAKDDEAAAKDREKAEKDLAAIEERHAKLRAEMAKLEEKQAAIAQQLDRPSKQPATIKLRSTAFNPQKALAKLADIWPKDGTIATPLTVVGKIYRVTPIGKASSELPIAEVANCTDEGDAKAAYARATNRQVQLEVEEIGREEYTRPTADPAAAVA